MLKQNFDVHVIPINAVKSNLRLYQTNDSSLPIWSKLHVGIVSKSNKNK